MFESEIQKAWDRYYEDFGLGRILLFICFFNLSVFVYIALISGVFYFPSLYPLVFSLTFYSLRRKLIKLSTGQFLVFSIVPLGFIIAYNYHMVGQIDLIIAHFNRMDPIFSKLDLWLFDRLATEVIEDVFRAMGVVGIIFYDIMMTSYILYFFLPFIGFYFYYSILPQQQKYKIGRYIGSIVIFYCLNYFLYLLFPVTGPQYYIKDFLHSELPLSQYGLWLYAVVQNHHHTFIDCFPSGHFGMALLVTFWMFRVGHNIRWACVVVCFFIFLATLGMRYHYLADLVGSIPLALFSYGIGKVLIPTKAQVVDC